MNATRVYVARLAGCAVFDPVGDKVGRVRDVLVVYRRDKQPPRVVGFVVEVPGRRRIFLSIGRVTSIGPGQIITTGILNLRRFEQRGGEVRVIAEMLGRQVSFVDGSGTGTVEDISIEETAPGEWEVAELYVRRPKTSPSPFAKGTTTVATWSEVRERNRGDAQVASQLLASYQDMLPADLANTLLDLPPERLITVASELSDARLADVLEEMPEPNQVEILNALPDLRAADVLDHMQPDDAADLVGQLSDERGEALLQLMEPDEADDVRMLLAYNPDTAGGLMTTEPVIVSADTTVAEGLALIRRQELAPQLAASVCVTLPPYEAPTGRFLGIVHFQTMLRYPPMERLGTLLDKNLEPVPADASAAEVSRILASYDLVAVPVVDANHRLVGVVTFDDVLDYLLPEDWRSADEDEPAQLFRADTSPINIVTPPGGERSGTT